MELFLNNSLEYLIWQSYIPYVINMKGHLINNAEDNVEGYSSQNSLFVDSKRQYHTKIYNIISSILFWVAPKILRTNAVNVIIFGLH